MRRSPAASRGGRVGALVRAGARGAVARRTCTAADGRSATWPAPTASAALRQPARAVLERRLPTGARAPVPRRLRPRTRRCAGRRPGRLLAVGVDARRQPRGRARAARDGAARRLQLRLPDGPSTATSATSRPAAGRLLDARRGVSATRTSRRRGPVADVVAAARRATSSAARRPPGARVADVRGTTAPPTRPRCARRRRRTLVERGRGPRRRPLGGVQAARHLHGAAGDALRARDTRTARRGGPFQGGEILLCGPATCARASWRTASASGCDRTSTCGPRRPVAV